MDETAFHREPATGTARWSIGIVATNAEDLAACVASLRAAGFGAEDTTLMVVRNFGRNHYDCYEAIHRFIDEAEGERLIVLHQDVTPLDDAAALHAALDALDARDPEWALAGNAGFRALMFPVYRITHPGDDNVRVGNPPQSVHSLDENLLILNLKDPVRPSAGLSGFHFYGTDLCLTAREAGRRAYVIDWLVRHDSLGSRNASWREGIAMIERHWQGRLGSLIVNTPTTLLLFGVFRILRPIRHKVYGAFWRIERRIWW